MNKKTIAVAIIVHPYVCTVCGQLQLFTDQQIGCRPPANCNYCSADAPKGVLDAGYEQTLKVRIFTGVRPHFDKGDSAFVTDEARK